MPERFKVVCTMQGAIQVLRFTFYLYLLHGKGRCNGAFLALVLMLCSFIKEGHPCKSTVIIRVRYTENKQQRTLYKNSVLVVHLRIYI